MTSHEGFRTAADEERLATALKAAASNDQPPPGFVDRVMAVVRTLPVLSPGLSRLARWIVPCALIGTGLAILLAVQMIPSVVDTSPTVHLSVPEPTDLSFVTVHSPATVVALAVVCLAILITLFMESSRK
jgi:hypothetical protein